MSLPEAWIDRIFSKMALTYGAAWPRMWAGLEPEAVKADWARELSGFQQNPEAIRYGLEYLPPSKPPTVLEFRDICRRSPPPVFKALPEPKPDPERLKRELSKLKMIRNRIGGGQ